MHGGLQMADLSVNGQTHQVDVDPNTPLLWVLRDTIGLTGTKYGCGIAQCGACTVHVDGVAMRSCSLPLSAVAGKQITTIEGLAQNGALHKVQKAWLDHDVPFGGPRVIRAAAGSPEVNAWVVIRPDDTVVIRIARSEMGQGTLTGLAQLVAEELDCDWSKVTTEYPTPGQNVARKRIWGDMSTGGSRGIRMSHEYVRRGGPAAREMLKQPPAHQRQVPASQITPP